MNIHLDELISSKKVLLLQGPMGSFFKKFSEWLSSLGIECFKINFNAGDWFYYSGHNVSHYRGKLKKFDVWLNKYLEDNNIDSIVCFGDCRFYHQVARQVAKQTKTKFFAFEEGYIRPYYITFEKNGVNAYSKFQECYQNTDISSPIFSQPDQPRNIDAKYSLILSNAICYYLFLALFFWLYPFYIHHRMISPLMEVFSWFKSYLRKFYYSLSEPKTFDRIIKQKGHRYFVVALQVHNDSQIRVHSDYDDVVNFIEDVITSFACYAQKDKFLVIKHHPMDRGYRDYTKVINSLAKKMNISDRVDYVCDVHLPTLMKNSLGMVTVNSTTGIQSLHHGKPVIALGRAIYNLDKLTFQGKLDDFWLNPGRVNKLYYRRFRYALVRYTQINGSFYGENNWMQIEDRKNDTVKVN